MPKKRATPTFSEQLRQAVRNCGQSKYRIAKATGITEQTLGRFVNGHQWISEETVDILAGYLGLRIESDQSTTTRPKGAK